MIIRKVEVSAFGVYKNYVLEHLSPGITVIEGRNEAGKSTLMALIRGVLFGFPNRKSPYERFDMYRGVPHGSAYGGALVIEDENGLLYRVERVGTTPSSGRVTVHMPDGTLGEDDRLRHLLKNTSAELFQNVFAFGLGELQQLQTLQTEEVSGFIYSAGIGGGGASVIEAEKKLTAKLERMYKPGGRNQAINTTLQQIEQLETQWRAWKRAAEQHASLLARNDEIEKEMAQVQAELESVERRERILYVLETAYPLWTSLLQARVRLDALPDTGEFPENGEEKLRLLEERIGELQENRKAIEQDQQNRSAERERLVVQEPVIENRIHIEEVAARSNQYQEWEYHAASLETSLRNQQETLQRFCAKLGPEWTVARIKAANTSIAETDKIREWQSRIEDAEADRRQIQQEMQEIERKRDDIARRVEELNLALSARQTRAGQPLTPLDVRKEALQQIKKDLAQVQRLQDKIPYQRDKCADLERQAAYAASRQTVRPRRVPVQAFWIAIGGSLALAVAMYLYFGMIPALGVAAAGCLGILLSFIWNFHPLPEHKEEESDFAILKRLLDTAQQEWRQTEQEIALRNDRIAAAAALLALRSVDDATLQNAEEAIYREEWLEQKQEELRNDIIRLSRESERLADDAKRVAVRLEEKEQHGRTLQMQWQAYLHEHGLPVSLSFDGARDLFLTLEQAKETLLKIEADSASLEQVRSKMHQFAERVRTLSAVCGISGIQQDPVALAQELKTLLAQNEKVWSEKQWLEQEIRAEEKRAEGIRAQIQALEEERLALLEKAGVTDSSSFRRLAAIHEERRANRKEIQELESQLTALVKANPLVDRDQLERLLQETSPGLVEDERLSLARRKENARERLAVLQKEMASLQAQIERLEEGGLLSDIHAQLQEHITTFRDQARQWAKMAICREILQRSREVYERERQPGVIRQASAYFRIMTGGEYVKIFAPLGEKTLIAETSRGERLEPGFLSRGTAEQLYLAMRLALAEEYGRVVKLPLVLDDVLVNFDRFRLARAIEALQEVAARHQVLLFTCHRHIADTVTETVPGTRHIVLRGMNA